MSSPKPPTPPSRAPLSTALIALVGSEAQGSSQRLEFTARGERVPARWLRPIAQAGSPLPLAIVVHDESETTHQPTLAGYHAEAVATLDMNWPLTGSRRSPKMSLRLLEALASPGESPVHKLLLEQFRAQALEEFACLLESAQSLAVSEIRHVDFILAPARERNPDAAQPLFARLSEPRHSQGISAAAAPERLRDFLDDLLP
ncbi:MAG: hypothetical protein P8Q97_08065 [Myxococcota bacterium]|jgi:hypothetical protein|nr:hypothetical protein [Myxococcota bacterium]